MQAGRRAAHLAQARAQLLSEHGAQHRLILPHRRQHHPPTPRPQAQLDRLGVQAPDVARDEGRVDDRHVEAVLQLAVDRARRVIEVEEAVARMPLPLPVVIEGDPAAPRRAVLGQGEVDGGGGEEGHAVGLASGCGSGGLHLGRDGLDRGGRVPASEEGWRVL